MTKVSNCGGDEHRGISGGQAGDQTGTEWYVRDWYDFGQDMVLRHPEQKVRQLIASMATEAAENDNIGYDQSQRETFFERLARVNYIPSHIAFVCEADCSSGTAAIVRGAGYRLDMDALKSVPVSLWTGNMAAYLKAAGFVALTDKRYLRSGDYLLAGDINLNQAAHVNICVTSGPKSGEIDGQSTSTVTSGLLAIDSWIGPVTVTEWQRQCKTTPDGVISGQLKDCQQSYPRLSSVTFEGTGSSLMRKVQEILGVPNPTGIIFRGTIAKLQGLLYLWGYDCSGDEAGVLDAATARAIQQSLNDRKWESEA